MEENLVPDARSQHAALAVSLLKAALVEAEAAGVHWCECIDHERLGWDLDVEDTIERAISAINRSRGES